MLLQYKLSDFSIKSQIFAKYIKLNNITVATFDSKLFETYVSKNYDLNDPNTYNIGYMNYIQSSIQKINVYNDFKEKAITDIYRLLNFKINDDDSIYGLFLPLFTNPQKFYKDNLLEISISILHKHLTLLCSTGGFSRQSELFELYSIFNQKFGIPLITKEDKQEFISLLKAS